jgi:hypothetical protein
MSGCLPLAIHSAIPTQAISTASRMPLETLRYRRLAAAVFGPGRCSRGYKFQGCFFRAGCSRPRTFHLGYDDLGLLRLGLHGLSHEGRACASFRLIFFADYKSRTALGRSFCWQCSESTCGADANRAAFVTGSSAEPINARPTAVGSLYLTTASFHGDTIGSGQAFWYLRNYRAETGSLSEMPSSLWTPWPPAAASENRVLVDRGGCPGVRKAPTKPNPFIDETSFSNGPVGRGRRECGLNRCLRRRLVNRQVPPL